MIRNTILGFHGQLNKINYEFTFSKTLMIMCESFTGSNNTCRFGELYCDNRCLDMYNICNSYRDCSDGSDEINCREYFCIDLKENKSFGTLEPSPKITTLNLQNMSFIHLYLLSKPGNKSLFPNVN